MSSTRDIGSINVNGSLNMVAQNLLLSLSTLSLSVPTTAMLTATGAVPTLLTVTATTKFFVIRADYPTTPLATATQGKITVTNTLVTSNSFVMASGVCPTAIGVCTGIDPTSVGPSTFNLCVNKSTTGNLNQFVYFTVMIIDRF